MVNDFHSEIVSTIRDDSRRFSRHPFFPQPLPGREQTRNGANGRAQRDVKRVATIGWFEHDHRGVRGRVAA
jgi:hypothetical protein